MHVVWRRSIGGISLRSRRRPALARPAPLEHGVDVRIWRKCWVLAAAPAIYRAGCARHRLWRRDSAGAQSSAGRDDASSGWEIANHGLNWIEYKDFLPEDKQAHLFEAIQLHTEVAGERPMGWYTRRCSEHTVDLEGGSLYVADSNADDLPYWHQAGDREQLIVPYTLDANNMRFATPQGFNAGDQFFSYLKDSFDTLYDEDQAGVLKMLPDRLHCRLIGRPGRVLTLRRFIEYAKAHNDIWLARRIDIARHWYERHPAVIGD